MQNRIDSIRLKNLSLAHLDLEYRPKSRDTTAQTLGGQMSGCQHNSFMPGSCESLSAMATDITGATGYKYPRHICPLEPMNSGWEIPTQPAINYFERD